MRPKFLIAAIATAILSSAAGSAMAKTYSHMINDADQTGAATAVSVWENSTKLRSFYNKNGSKRKLGYSPRSNEALFFLHKNTRTGALGLALILDANDGTGGTSAFTLTGAPVTAKFAVKDGDQGGEIGATVNGAYNFRWGTRWTDGFAASGLENTAWTITFDNLVQSGINSASFLNADGSRVTINNFANDGLSITAAPVPVPAGLPLAASGLALLGWMRARRT